MTLTSRSTARAMSVLSVVANSAPSLTVSWITKASGIFRPVLLRVFASASAESALRSRTAIPSEVMLPRSFSALPAREGLTNTSARVSAGVARSSAASWPSWSIAHGWCASRSDQSAIKNDASKTTTLAIPPASLLSSFQAIHLGNRCCSSSLLEPSSADFAVSGA